MSGYGGDEVIQIPYTGNAAGRPGGSDSAGGGLLFFAVKIQGF